MSAVTFRIENMFYVSVFDIEQTRVTHVSGLDDSLSEASLPVALEAVAAGWPSAAQDYYSGELDLNSHLVSNRAATFVVRVAGDSMLQAGISDGDELIVDRSLEPKHGHVVIAVLDGELTVKRLEITASGVFLRAANPRYPDIGVAELSDLQIWGVVTRCLHHVS